MSEPRVVHFKKEGYDVYIGRPGPWGNPFTSKKSSLAKKVGSKQEAIKLYREWISLPEQAGQRQRARAELKGKVLGCWCKPSDCHGDVLLAIANGLPIPFGEDNDEKADSHAQTQLFGDLDG